MKKELVKFLKYLRNEERYDVVGYMIEIGEECLNAETYAQFSNYVAQVSAETGFNFEQHREELSTAVLDSVDNWLIN